MNLQDLVDGMNQRMQRERAATQMTLGKMIETLSAMPAGAVVANIGSPHSYRGYYDDLAFTRGDGTRQADELLALCQAAMGEVFEGYKGGDFVMGRLTPVWIANYGRCGRKLISLGPNGEIETEEDL